MIWPNHLFQCLYLVYKVIIKKWKISTHIIKHFVILVCVWILLNINCVQCIVFWILFFNSHICLIQLHYNLIFGNAIINNHLSEYCCVIIIDIWEKIIKVVSLVDSVHLTKVWCIRWIIHRYSCIYIWRLFIYWWCITSFKVSNQTLIICIKV